MIFLGNAEAGIETRHGTLMQSCMFSYIKFPVAGFKAGGVKILIVGKWSLSICLLRIPVSNGFSSPIYDVGTSRDNLTFVVVI